jgi:PAS domain S-box-containing protein
MRLLTLLFCFLLILAWWTRAYAQVDDVAKTEPVILTDGQDEYPLGLHLEILEDPGGELTIEDVASQELDSRFIASQVKAPNYGFTDSVYWARLHLRSEARLTDRWLLDVGFANMHFVDLYTPLADGDGFEEKQTGSLRSPETRDISHPHIVLNLTIPSQSEQTIYLRFQNGGPMILPLTLWQPNVFADETLGEQILEGVFFGVVFGLLLYYLFLFLSLREVPYLYLVLLLIGVAAYEASQANYLELYLVPSSYQVKQHIIALATALIMISIVLLHDTFLTAKKLYPNIYRMDMVLIGVWGVLAPLTFLTSYHNLATVMAPMIVVTLSASSLALIAAWPRGFRANRALIIALLGLFASILLFILGRLGVISNVTITENLFRIGFISIAVAWSLALADRVSKLKSETEEANLELRSSERWLSQILEGLPLGVAVYGKDQKPSFANRRVTEIFSTTAQGIEPDPSSERTLVESMKRYSIRVAGTDEAYPIENIPVYRALQGEPASVDDAEADLVDKRVPLEIWANPVVDGTGDVEAAVVAFQDITARKQVEKELHTSEKKFRAIVENNFDGIIFMGRDRKIFYVSPSYEQLIGFKAEEMLGKSGAGFVHPDDRARIAGVFAEILQQPGIRFRDEYRLVHEDGSLVWIETNAMNLLDDPAVQAVVLNSRNITQRKRTEVELTEYHEKLEHLVEERTRELQDARTQIATLFDSSPLGIAMATFDGTILGVNQAMQRISGYSEDELLHINLEQLYADPEQQFQVLEHLGKFGSLQDYGIKLGRRDGSFYYASLNLSKLEMAGQEVLLGVIDDVSNQVEIKEALTTLHNISYVLSSIGELPTLINDALGHLYKIVDFNRAALMLVEEDGESMTIHAYVSPSSPPEFSVNHVPISRFPSIQAILEKREAAHVPDMHAVETIQAELDNIETGWWAAALKSSRSWLSLPLTVGERTVGLLNILHGESHLYSPEDVELAKTFSNQLAVAIDNIHLSEISRLAAAANERSRIARDLHDSVTQVLFSASLLAELLPQRLRRDPESALQTATELRRLSRGALAEMRTLLLELRPSTITKTPLGELLAQLADAIASRTELSLQLNIERGPHLPADVQTTFYRIAQETMNNVLKHAQAEQMLVSLSVMPPVGSRSTEEWEGEIIMLIKDDGIGFNPGKQKSGHMGLGIMKERVAAIDAILNVESQSGQGTAVTLIWHNN